jgi:CheY-like chemotaxis protein
MAGSGTPKLLLLAEDDPVASTIHRHLLEGAGYGLVSFADGASALACLMAEDAPHFDLIVTDYHMPGKTGGVLIDYARWSERWRETPVLLLSATVSRFEVEQFLEHEYTSFMAKPVQPKALFTAIEALLNTGSGLTEDSSV